MPMPATFLKNTRKVIITCLLSFATFALVFSFPVAAQLEILPSPQKDQLSAMPKVYVRQVKLEGNTVFSSLVLSEVLSPYENREITSEELQDLRRKLTQYYVDKGYVNSGVIIPDQKMIDGVLALRVVEGTLSKIEISGNEYFRDSYLEKRLKLGAGPPLNIFDLRESLLVLQQDPRIERINAKLSPGVEKDESVLKVQVEENLPYTIGAEVGNVVSPAIGGVRGGMHFIHDNLTGNGDILAGDIGITTNGLADWDAAYSIPITTRDTMLSLQYRRNQSTIIETPFKNLDIESLTDTMGITLSHPFLKRADTEFSLGLTGERRYSKTTLLGRPYSFSAGVKDGEATVTALRFFQEYMLRSQSQVLALRSTFNLGVDAFDASVDFPDPNGKFFAWQAQIQFIRRLFDTDMELAFRTNAQLSSDPLLPVEKFPIGGMYSVRGYRENRLVRDNGVASSLECRIPVLYGAMGRRILQLTPFFDYGASWNTSTPTFGQRQIYSLGLALRWDITDKIRLMTYGAIPFVSFDDADEDLQDKGFQFLIVGELF